MADIIDYLALTPHRWLSENKAVDTNFFTKTPKQDQAQILSVFNALSIRADLCIQPESNRKKKLLMCDMDSTLIGQECIDELADYAGVKDEVSKITERAMQGEIGFEGALEARVALLKGLPLETLQDCYNTRIHLNKGAKTLAATMKRSGAKTVIVSGGFTFFTERVAHDAGFDDHNANILLSDNGKLTGKVAYPILGREAKLKALKSYSDGLGGPKNAVAIGDGANDLAMIEAAGLGIAYKAKPAVAKAASCAINYTDLTTALYFQGYCEREFVDG